MKLQLFDENIYEIFVRHNRGHGGRHRVNIVMLFVRPTRGHGGRYRVNIILCEHACLE